MRRLKRWSLTPSFSNNRPQPPQRPRGHNTQRMSFHLAGGSSVVTSVQDTTGDADSRSGCTSTVILLLLPPIPVFVFDGGSTTTCSICSPFANHSGNKPCTHPSCYTTSIIFCHSHSRYPCPYQRSSGCYTRPCNGHIFYSQPSQQCTRYKRYSHPE
jgi:hypothetical protein